MKRNLWALLAAATLPCASFAAGTAPGIVGSKHDLSFVAGNTNNIRGTTDTETCKYCHSPHHVPSQSLLFNKTLSVATYAWAGSNLGKTTRGTALPTSLVNHSSALCMGCHDGTVAIGAVFNAGGGVPGVIAVSGIGVTGGFMTSGSGLLTTGAVQGTLSPAGNAVGGSGDLGGNHPFGIPYAGATYFGVTSTEPATGAQGAYWAIAAGATTPSAAYIGTGAAAIKLASGTGIECATCHDVHNALGTDKLTVISNNQSALCRSCHVR